MAKNCKKRKGDGHLTTISDSDPFDHSLLRFGVRSEKLLKYLPLTLLGRPSGRRPVRKRFDLDSQLRAKVENVLYFSRLE